jgi:predicted acylesterase/phospholipase RssA/CRP-like cAMP-binding protein
MADVATQIGQAIENYFGTELDTNLADRFDVCDVKGGDWLFHQGDDCDALYLLVRGRLQVLLEIHEGDKPRLLGEVIPGESVGEVGLLTGEARSAGVRAIRDSLLVKIDRKPFEDLSASNPSLVLKLAAHVAKLLQRTNVGSAAARQFNTIALVPLADSERCAGFCSQLTKTLAAFGDVLDLSQDNLPSQGKPPATPPQQDISPELQYWIHNQETDHRFVIYDCEANDSDWTRFAVRQSDLVVFVADAKSDPTPMEWETRLLGGGMAIAGRRALVLLHPPSDKAITGTARWLKNRQVDFHLHVRQDQHDDIARVARVISGNALGLVFGAGGARGFAHLGVYKALLELGVPVDWVGGASIGSILGAPIASGWSFADVYRTARHSFVKGKPFGDYTLPVVALLRGKRMDLGLRASQTGSIEDMPIPFFCVSSILDNGELRLHERGNLADALRASAAMPGVMPPAVVDRRLNIDGSVLNSLPVDIMQGKPVGKIIAVDLSSQKSFEVDYPSIPSPWTVLAGRLLPFFRRYRVPSLATTILKATEIGTQAQVRESGQLADLLLRPPVRKFGLTEVKVFDKVVDAGYQYARSELETWLQTTNIQCGDMSNK